MHRYSRFIVNIIYLKNELEMCLLKRDKVAKFCCTNWCISRLVEMHKILDTKRESVKLCELTRHLTKDAFCGIILQ